MKDLDKLHPEMIAKILREHNEMLQLIDSFPEKIDQISGWLEKRKIVLDKIQKK